MPEQTAWAAAAVVLADSTSKSSSAVSSETQQSGPSDPQSNQIAPNNQASNGTSSAKASGAELKKQKKAEKAARRAQAKDTGGPLQSPQSSTSKNEPSGEVTQNVRGEGNTAQPGLHNLQQQQRRSEPAQRSLPLRQVRETAEKPSPKIKKDDKNVALFGHLYGQPRRTTLAHAGKDVHPSVLALGLKYSSYAICGSTARCVGMLLSFKRLIDSYTTPPGHALSRHLVSYLSPQIEYLVSCRPLAISMGNAIRWLKTEIAAADLDAEEGRVKADLCDAIDTFVRERISAAGQVIANTAQEKIQDGDVILTFGKSQVVQQTLIQALRSGRKFEVIVLDSRPLHEGRNMARALSDIGIDVTFSSIHAVSHLVDCSTKVLLGAHSMLGNGRLYSRAGSAIIAMMAHAADIPVIVCCESIKFTDRVALDSIVTNEVAPPEELVLNGDNSTALSKWRHSPNLQLLNLMYDVTPAEYISMIITEHGSLPPSSVPVVHRLSTNT